jgi:hypothetical protein
MMMMMMMMMMAKMTMTKRLSTSFSNIGKSED